VAVEVLVVVVVAVKKVTAVKSVGVDKK